MKDTISSYRIGEGIKMEDEWGLKHDKIHKEKRVKRKVKVHRASKAALWKNEEALDRGVTVDPREFEVTEELIEEIASGTKKTKL